MSNFAFSWKNLQKQLITFGLILLVCLTSVCGAYLYKSHQNNLLIQNQRALNQINSKISEAENNTRIINEYLNEFQELTAKNVIGQEDRLNWIETLQNSSNEFLIPLLKYKIDSRSRYEVSQFLNSAVGVSLFRTEMVLSMELLHEADFLNLFDELAQKAQGLFSIQECNIKALNSGKDLSYVFNLQGRCSLFWYTIEEGGDEMI